jgi:hypothetical protein
MKKNINQETIDKQLKQYFNDAKAVKCPDSMKQNLYAQTIHANNNSWLNNKFVLAGVSMALMVTVFIKTNTYQATIDKTNLQNKQLLQAQNELNIAMQYINRVSFKSLASVKNKGIQPAVIRPMARSLASI